jgi:rhodanese-related sulfurtransferase
MTYAGDLTPRQAWELLESNDGAVLVDVRTAAEWQFVGVPLAPGDAVLAEWNTAHGHNDDFVAQAASAAGLVPGDNRPLVCLCRSGQRSIGAAEALTAAGFGPAYNVLDGFEGAVDEHGHRGSAGWRAEGLPWRQQ